MTDGFEGGRRGESREVDDGRVPWWPEVSGITHPRSAPNFPSPTQHPTIFFRAGFSLLCRDTIFPPQPIIGGLAWREVIFSMVYELLNNNKIQSYCIIGPSCPAKVFAAHPRAEGGGAGQKLQASTRQSSRPVATSRWMLDMVSPAMDLRNLLGQSLPASLLPLQYARCECPVSMLVSNVRYPTTLNSRGPSRH
ncbi:uncharacterized protein KD926_009093 [Aspergillus affinis]|uniref:uncharacterized protein n=1 Tax=Aspergillus affinis TaxID=1070780 RepID=UPI0022FDCC12|nr:uncharacterized protein KD926_009093 [Aspergillus affinis]KAI9039750.1 hypothetical protein KD926_009093 [Aspergillus affinis]